MTMTKVLGRGTYSAYRQNGLLHVIAQGDKPNLQTIVTIEQEPFLIFPPEFALYFENPPIVSPIVVPFHVEKSFSYPPNVNFVRIVDATGTHSITIENRPDITPPIDNDGANFCVFQQLGTDRYRIARCDAIVPTIYHKVFGPTTYQQCQIYIAAHSAGVGLQGSNGSLVQADPATFKAWINEMPGSQPTLIVTGDVLAEVDFHVNLVRAIPQGFNPAVLILHIDVQTPTGPHSNAIATRTLRYEEAAAIRFTNVTVTGGGNPFTIPVTIAH
jgi:hypothetical protein